ncbi:MAG TPA: ankyrin repeat domain-containing protein [Gemmatimonadaceae bacterium]|nr:ankyrin repeat domain-containing protein [Gemmatimonadaceae bacterium]
MDTLPLPPRPNLDQYKKRAKSLVAAAQSDDPNTVRRWATEWLESLVALLGVAPSEFVRHSMDRAVTRIIERVAAKRRPGDRVDRFGLADAQFVIAEAHSFENWAAFARHVGGDSQLDPHDVDFERAADAVVNGHLETLAALVIANPRLIRERSSRVHHVTLLHYVAANGVEDFRQKTPTNAVEITRYLLGAGAEPDASADTYGTDTLQTTMNLLVSSAHPAKAGLQSAIAEALLDYGAAVNGVANDESPLMTALRFGYIDPAETLARRGARIDAVVTAASLGQLDLVRDMVVDARTLKPGVPLISTPWTPVPPDPRVHIELALAWACKFARSEVALFLLDIGVNPVAMDSDKMTALHWASANGMMVAVDELLRRSVPLEAENKWGGTLLNSTLHFALYIPVDGVDYVPVLERLLQAGANVHVVDYPTGNARIDELFAKYGAVRR